jgi:hypothetical protein
MKQKPKTCKICRTRFMPLYSSLQPVCTNVHCVLEYAKLNKHKKEKREIKAMRERTKSISSWRRDLQQVFNQYIRLRDANKGCISCGKPLKEKYDAGHFYSVGSYPNLRFHESNCFGQCVECNQHKHGNLLEYRERILDRITYEQLEELLAKKDLPLRLSLPEIQEKIKEYKHKVKQFKK